MKTECIKLLLFIFMMSNQIFARDLQPQQIRIERLAGLAKVWGTVKYFHPFLAYKDIDWDKALIETIPLVNSAKTPEEYKSAVNYLLASLNDKNTFAENLSTNSIQPPQITENRELVRLETGVLIIEAGQIARLSVKDNSKYRENAVKIEQNYPQAKAVIIDLRVPFYEADEDIESIGLFADEFLRNALAKMIDKDVVLGTIRYRMHNGFEPQTGGTSGGYYSGFITDTPLQITGQNKNKTLPMAAIVNDNSPSVVHVLSGLQSVGAALIVQEGNLTKEPGVPTYTINLPDDIKVRMRTAEVVNADGGIGFQPDSVITKNESGRDWALAKALEIVNQNNFKHASKTTSANLSMRNFKDKPYPEMEFPNMEYRLLALFRFWNVINYFYPYKDLIGEPWDNILHRYIPKFEADKNALEYNYTVQELMAETKDSHTLIRATSLNPKDVKNPIFFRP